MRAAGPVTSYRHSEKKPCTNSYIKPVVLSVCRRYGARKAIDLGCGNGSLCRDMADAGLAVTGIEPGSSGVSLARKLVPEAVFYEIGVYDDPALVKESEFDIAVSTEVIEHLFRPAELPKFARAKLKTGGLLLVSTPYHGYLKNLTIVLFNKWDRHHVPWSEGGHIKFWSRKSLAALLEANGFRVIEFHGVGRLPWLWKSMIVLARKEG